jgi:hypothetical protein
MLAYAATKSALWTMTRYLARECAPEVRVNAICPGTVQEGSEMKVPTWSKLLPLTALGRVGDSNELAGAALFLASDASSYTTGQVIFVDGGRVMTAGEVWLAGRSRQPHWHASHAVGIGIGIGLLARHTGRIADGSFRRASSQAAMRSGDLGDGVLLRRQATAA